MINFTIFGLQRSGTNFVERLIMANIAGMNMQYSPREWLWKHDYGCNTSKNSKGDVGRIIDKSDRRCCVFMTKHPYTWIQSMFRYPADAKNTWDITENGELNVKRLAKLWNDHSEWWDRFLSNTMFPFYTTTYETIVADELQTRRFVTWFAEVFGLNLRNHHIKIPKQVPQSSAFTEKNREIYKNVLLRRDIFSWEMVDTINSIIDGRLMERYGYEKYDENEFYERLI